MHDDKYMQMKKELLPAFCSICWNVKDLEKAPLPPCSSATGENEVVAKNIIIPRKMKCA